MIYSIVHNNLEMEVMVKPRLKVIIVMVMSMFLLSLNLHAAQYTIELISDDVSVPWGITQLPDNSLLVTDRKGTMRVISLQGKSTQVTGLPKIVAKGQGGLLDVVLHPDYSTNSWIYFSYSTGENGRINTAISRAKLAKSQADYQLTHLETLYQAEAYNSGGAHFGSRIAFDNDNYLYFSIGDRGQRDINPQDLNRDAGKIYRLHDDGSIPKDNPFVAKNKAKTAVFSYGHRNPQGLAFNPHTQAIWSHEHGPKGGDELNIIGKGNNYGWPVISYGVNYSGSSFTDLTKKQGMEQPITYWVPSIAPSGMVFVTSDKYPKLNNHLLIGSLKFAKLIAVSVTGNKVAKQHDVLKSVGRLRSVFQGSDNHIYLGIDGRGVFRLVPTNN